MHQHIAELVVQRRRLASSAAANALTGILHLTQRQEELIARAASIIQQRERPGIPTTLYNPQQGLIEVNRILYYDPQYCRSTTRLQQDVLKKLIGRLHYFGLSDSRISVAEKVVMFLDYCAHKKSYREMRRLYQHSFRTFTRHFKAVALALAKLFQKSISNRPDLTRVNFDPAAPKFSRLTVSQRYQNLLATTKIALGTSRAALER